MYQVDSLSRPRNDYVCPLQIRRTSYLGGRREEPYRMVSLDIQYTGRFRSKS